MKNNRIDEDEVHRLALVSPNPRMSREGWKYTLENTAPLQRRKDFKKRALSGGELAFIEAKILIKEQLSFKYWMLTFYEMVQFPQMLFFETEAEAVNYYTRATIDGRTPKGAKLMAQRMELYGPKKELFGGRQKLMEWKCEGYKPDPLMASGYR